MAKEGLSEGATGLTSKRKADILGKGHCRCKTSSAKGCRQEQVHHAEGKPGGWEVLRSTQSGDRGEGNRQVCWNSKQFFLTKNLWRDFDPGWWRYLWLPLKTHKLLCICLRIYFAWILSNDPGIETHPSWVSPLLALTTSLTPGVWVFHKSSNSLWHQNSVQSWHRLELCRPHRLWA